MKIAGAFFWVFLWMVPATLKAETVVRSGEHDGFTRLVFYFDRDVDWKLGRVADGYGLATENPPQQYDLTRVFDRIPRTRVSALIQNHQHLSISVACACHLRAFELSPEVLVVDVLDGPAERGSPFERPLDPVPSEPLLSLLPTATDLFMMGPLPETRLDTDQSETRQDQARTLDPELSTALARAVFDGVLEPATQERMPRPPHFMSAPQVLAQTATDLLNPQQHAPVLPQCPDAAHLNFLKRAGVATLDEAVEELLRRIDQEGPASMGEGLAVASQYLFLGFGAEARAELDKLGKDTPSVEFLREISYQLDAPGRVKSDLLGPLADCPGSAALWGVLGLGEIEAPASVKVNTEAVFHTVSGLPLHLRAHLAPAVSRQLRLLGLDETATAVRSTVDRTMAAASGDMIVEQAMAAPEGVASTDLKDLTRSRDLVGLEAQSILLEDIRRGQGGLSADQQREVEAQITSAKGSREARQLLQSYMQAMIHIGEFEPALTFLSDQAESRFARELGVPEAYDEVMSALANSGEEAELVYLSAAYFPHDRLTINPQAGAQIAGRLGSYGFPTLASRYRSLSAPTERDRTMPGVISEPIPLDEDLIAARYGAVPDGAGAPGPEPRVILPGQQTASAAASERQTPGSRTPDPAGREGGAVPAAPTLAAQKDLLAQSARLREIAETLLAGSPADLRESSP